MRPSAEDNWLRSGPVSEVAGEGALNFGARAAASANRQFGQLPAGPSAARRAPQFGQRCESFKAFMARAAPLYLQPFEHTSEPSLGGNMASPSSYPKAAEDFH